MVTKERPRKPGGTRKRDKSWTGGRLSGGGALVLMALGFYAVSGSISNIVTHPGMGYLRGGFRRKGRVLDDQAYTGTDQLEVFSEGKVWKRYITRQIAPYLGNRVLEVGAGFGACTAYLAPAANASRWVCLEPDDRLFALLKRAHDAGDIPASCELHQSTLANFDADARFDSILYLDVLEHIEDDAAEAARAYERMAPGGHLIVLCPAHQFLYSPFDKAVGHFRRYSRPELKHVLRAHKPVAARYLDSVGYLASLANRLVLRAAMPSARQIWFWDKIMVRLSRVLDPILAFGVGKSVLVVWRK